MLLKKKCGGCRNLQPDSEGEKVEEREEWWEEVGRVKLVLD